MMFREHRGGLIESLETQREIPATREAVALEASAAIGLAIEPAEIKVQACGYDQRTMSQTYLLSVKGVGVIGFCDEPLPEAQLSGPSAEELVRRDLTEAFERGLEQHAEQQLGGKNHPLTKGKPG